MLSRLNLIFLNFKKKEKFMNYIIKTVLAFFFFYFSFFDLKYAEASTIQNDKLIERISNDYTNKFCNSIAFGLSQESAMNFAYKENNLIFKNKKGIESINKDLIANKIAISVIDYCGYIVNLNGKLGD